MDFKEHHTDVTVHFVLSVAPDRLREMGVDGLESKLKLTTKFSTSERRRHWALSASRAARAAALARRERARVCVLALAAGNMMLFDKDGLIKHYPTPEHIVAEFCDLRLEYYEKRRQALLKVRPRRLSRCAATGRRHADPGALYRSRSGPRQTV